jgi:hypothetical protein
VAAARLQAYRLKQIAMVKFWKSVRDHSSKVLIDQVGSKEAAKTVPIFYAYGDGSWLPGTRGRPSGGIKMYSEALSKTACVIMTDEFRTSLTCNRCWKHQQQEQQSTDDEEKKETMDCKMKEEDKKEVHSGKRLRAKRRNAGLMKEPMFTVNEDRLADMNTWWHKKNTKQAANIKKKRCCNCDGCRKKGDEEMSHKVEEEEEKKQLVTLSDVTDE